MNCKDCGKISWRTTRNGFMFKCEEFGRKEQFVSLEEFQLDRNLLQKYTENIVLDIVKKKFHCKK